jgi:hypothetical protein
MAAGVGPARRRSRGRGAGTQRQDGEAHHGSLESSGLLSLSMSRADAFLGALWGAS